MSRTPGEHIANAREHLRVLHEHLDRGDLDDSTIFDAVCMRLSAAIESIGSIDEDLRNQVFVSTWPAVWSVRNRIAHGYIYVDQTIITSTVTGDLPSFENDIDRLDALVANDELHAGD